MNLSVIFYLLVGVVVFLFGFSPPAFVAFTITNVAPSEINSSNDAFTVDVSTSSLESNPQYLQLALTAVGSPTNLLGFTQNNAGSWYVYKSSPTSSDLTSTFYSFTHDNGSWSGQISGKVDIEDTGYIGSGQYNLRLYKYTISEAGNVSSSYVTWSSPTVVNISASSTPTPTFVPTNTPVPTTAPTATKTPTPTPIKTPTPTPKSSSSGGSGATATPKPTSPPTSAPTKILALSSQAAGGSGNINTAISPTATSSPTSTKEPTKKPTPTITTAILGVAQSNLSKILIGAGVIFLLACGILAFRNFKREKIS